MASNSENGRNRAIEVRTPINAIMGFAQLPQLNDFNPDLGGIFAEHSVVEGIGLRAAVAKRLVEGTVGTLAIESTAEQDSVLSAELPLTESSALADAGSKEAAAPASVSSGLPRTVLYIEDNNSNLRLIERLLDRRPHVTLISASEGLAGLHMAREQHPDLILLDINLPDINGDEVLLRLRADPACASMPVIVLSADATSNQIDRLMQRGAADYITKPINVPRFFEVVDRTLAETKFTSNEAAGPAASPLST